MPRVTHVKSARKDNPVCKKGESYFWWKFRYGGKRYSLTRPRASQLTQSAYYGTVRSLCEQIEDANIQDSDELISVRDDIQSELECLRDETQESLDNMPDALQYSPTGELLQERIDAVENALSEVENIEEFDEDEPLQHEYEKTEDCDDCNGTGKDDEEEDCPECEGSGEIEDDGEEEYNAAQSEWEENMRSHIDEQVSTMMDEVSNCEV
jgi:hypothetical protein